MNISRLPVEKGLFRAVFILASLIFLALFLSSSRNDPALHDSTPLPLVIDIQGDIGAPGVCLLPGPCAAISDVLKAAGIPEEIIQGREGVEDLGRQVYSGSSVNVKLSKTGGLAVRLDSMPAEARLTLGERLDLNEATQEELCLVPLMKPEFASAVVERRSQRAWERLEDLEQISGVGPKTVEKWKEYLEVRGRKK